MYPVEKHSNLTRLLIVYFSVQKLFITIEKKSENVNFQANVSNMAIIKGFHKNTEHKPVIVL